MCISPSVSGSCFKGNISEEICMDVVMLNYRTLFNTTYERASGLFDLLKTLHIKYPGSRRRSFRFLRFITSMDERLFKVRLG